MNKTPILKTYRVPRVLQIRSVRSSSLSDVAIQQAINVQILSQLSSISDRLNILEKKDAKKNSDPKKIQLSERKLVVMLPRSHCHNTSVLLWQCLVCKASERMPSYRVRWTRD